MYVIFFAPQFKISKIEVYASADIDSDKIKNFLLARIGRIFFTDKKSLVREVLMEFSSIKSVNIKKKFPDGIFVKIQERQPVAVFCSQQEQCFFIDGEGVVFEELDSVSDNTAIIRQDSNDQDIYLGKNLVNEMNMGTIRKVMDGLKNNFQISIKEIFISEYLIFTTSERWKIYFDQNSDINFQIAKMNLLLRDEISLNDRKNLQYIYLQYKDKAYYK